MAFVIALVWTGTITREEVARIRKMPSALRTRLHERTMVG
jgi:hypothetical protein